MVKLGEVIINYDKQRIPLSSLERKQRQGKYRYYGAQGVIDHIDDYIFDGEYLLIAEDGENLKSKKQPIAQIVSGKFWVNNHAHIISSDEKSNLKYLCYLLNLIDLSAYITGSAQPKLNQKSLNNIDIHLPSLEIQNAIVDIISSFDEKIELNRNINHHLFFRKLLTLLYFVSLLLVFLQTIALGVIHLVMIVILLFLLLYFVFFGIKVMKNHETGLYFSYQE